jgi:hypothetical protein
MTGTHMTTKQSQQLALAMWNILQILLKKLEKDKYPRLSSHTGILPEPVVYGSVPSMKVEDIKSGQNVLMSVGLMSVVDVILDSDRNVVLSYFVSFEKEGPPIQKWSYTLHHSLKGDSGYLKRVV